jgi:hypothetical protein
MIGVATVIVRVMVQEILAAVALQGIDVKQKKRPVSGTLSISEHKITLLFRRPAVLPAAVSASVEQALRGLPV